MVGYVELAQLKTFSVADAEAITGNRKSAHSMVNRLMKKGLVRKIRNGLYSCVNPETGDVIASKYHIATAINETAYVSHHSAFEFYGVANQVYYDVFVASKSRFAKFSFEGMTYRFVASKFCDGVVEPANTEGIRVTDLERTVVDSMKDFSRIGGLEELLHCIDMITFLDEGKLKSYLDRYDLQFVYQKTGYILEQYQQDLKISDSFFDYCLGRIGKSTRYLQSDGLGDSVYNRKWRLVVPTNLFHMYEQGGDEFA